MSSSDKMTIVKFFAEPDSTTKEKLAIAKEFDLLDDESKQQLANGIRDGSLTY